MLHVESHIKILVYCAISYNYYPRFALLENTIKYFAFGSFLNSRHAVEIISLSCKENNWTSSQGPCLFSLAASTRVDKHDPQNTIAHCKWKKASGSTGRHWIPFPSTIHNRKFISLQEYKTRWLEGLFSIIIWSKNMAEVLFTKKHRSKRISEWGNQENTLQLFLTTNLSLHLTSSKICYC